MSKLSFRARPLEASKPMPIYMSEELPDLPEYSAINRAVPQMPSGMKKEEECEHHLQRAIVTGLIIPTPEVIHIRDMAIYNRLYPPNYKLPRQLIHMQPFTMKQDIPDYDMDSDDEKWLHIHSKTMDIDALKFEEMMDRLEKNSGHSVVTQSEAKILLKEDDDLVIAVYDYWLNKRLQTQQSLIPCVKTEAHRGSNSNNNPYLAFRRRTEKMQTRKNRKNDESTYEKMVKLKRDLSRAHTLLELIKKRENTKRELLQLTVEIFEKRYQAEDFSGQMLAEVSALKTPRSAFAPLFTNQYNHESSWSKSVKDEYLPRKEKRQYKKRKHKIINANLLMNDMGSIISSGDNDDHNVSSTSPTHDEAPFAFRRKRHCLYHAPLSTGFGNWPWTSREEGGMAHKIFRFNLTSIATPATRCVGFARRRLGRGGRVILDRAGPPMDDFWSSLDFTIQDNTKEKSVMASEKLVDDKLSVEVDNKLVTDEKYLQNSDSFLDWPHFHPKMPIKTELEEEQVQDVLNNSSLSLMVEDLDEPNNEFTPVHLNLSELFPNLVWDSSDQELIKQDSDTELITSQSERDFDYQVLDMSKSVEPIDSEILTKSVENDFDVTTKNFKRACMDKKEYQSGSLLDRWARFESPPPEPVTKLKPTSLEPFLVDDLSGSSLFRTSNIWPESKLQTVSELSAAVPAIMEEQPESTGAVKDEISILLPTPLRENKTLTSTTNVYNLNNITSLTNGPVSLAHSDQSKKLGYMSYQKKNNNVHSYRLNNNLIVRLSENAEDILDSSIVKTEVISDKIPDESLMRK